MHLVTGELDGGPIVLQAAVPVQADDTVETLSARILAEEHRLYPEAVRVVLDGGWRVDGRRFVVPVRVRGRAWVRSASHSVPARYPTSLIWAIQIACGAEVGYPLAALGDAGGGRENARVFILQAPRRPCRLLLVR